jgi:hypothetical protein
MMSWLFVGTYPTLHAKHQTLRKTSATCLIQQGYFAHRELLMNGRLTFLAVSARDNNILYIIFQDVMLNFNVTK